MEGAVSAVPGSSHNFPQNPRLGYSRHKKVKIVDLSSNIKPLCSTTSPCAQRFKKTRRFWDLKRTLIVSLMRYFHEIEKK